MDWEQFVVVASAVFAIALAYVTIVGAAATDQPPNITIPKIVGDVADKRRFASSGPGDYQVQGRFGEFYSSILAAADGWVQIPSKVNGNEGIDGLFLKAIKDSDGKTQMHVLILETKTESSELGPKQMSQSWILGNLGLLYAASPEGEYRRSIEEITKAVQRKSSFIHREMWRHLLTRGETQRFTIDADRNVKTASSPVPHASPAFMKSLFDASADFDYQQIYIR